MTYVKLKAPTTFTPLTTLPPSPKHPLEHGFQHPQHKHKTGIGEEEEGHTGVKPKVKRRFHAFPHLFGNGDHPVSFLGLEFFRAVFFGGNIFGGYQYFPGVFFLGK